MKYILSPDSKTVGDRPIAKTVMVPQVIATEGMLIPMFLSHSIIVNITDRKAIKEMANEMNDRYETQKYSSKTCV